MSVLFPNAKPKLFGDPENSMGIIDTPAESGLSGSVDATPDNGATNTRFATVEIFNRNPYRSGISVNQVLVTVTSVVVAAGEKVLLTYVWISDYSNNNQDGAMTHSLQRDASEITTFANGNYNETIRTLNSQFIDSPGAGTFSYRIQITAESSGGLQYVALTANVIKITDTHEGIIPTPATATKQINTPDTHTTHETEVLP